MAVYFSLFTIVFLIKFSNGLSCLVLLLAFIIRLFQLTLVKLLIVFIIISQGPTLGFFIVEMHALYATVDLLTRIIN